MPSTATPPAPAASPGPTVRLRQRLAVQRTLAAVLVELATERSARSRELSDQTAALVQDLATALRQR